VRHIYVNNFVLIGEWQPVTGIRRIHWLTFPIWKHYSGEICSKRKINIFIPGIYQYAGTPFRGQGAQRNNGVAQRPQRKDKFISAS